MAKEELSKNTIYKVSVIGGKIKKRNILQKKIDDVEAYARKYNLTLNIEWEE